MSISTYSYKEIQELIRQMLSIYDLVRLVDANECRELTFTPDGNIIPADSCYSVWDADQRCANCSSYKAFKSQTRVEKEEYFENKKYHILSEKIMRKSIWQQNLYSMWKHMTDNIICWQAPVALYLLMNIFL